MAEIDVQAILADVQSRVRALRSEGHYPVGLESELESEFRGIMALTKLSVAGRMDSVERQLDEIRDVVAQIRQSPRTESRFMFGRLIHSAINRLVGRPFHDVADRTTVALVQLLEHLYLFLEELRSRDGVEDHVANAMAKHVMERVAVVDHLAVLVTELEARIDVLERESS